MFIHGLWLLPSSWDRWAELFESAGYSAVQLAWPGDAETVAGAREHPESLARRGVREIGDHLAAAIARVLRKPAVIGHSFGGLFAQMMAGRGLSAVTVALDPAPFRGVLPLPVSAVKATLPVLRNPANRGRGVALTYEQFRFAFANAVSEEEARRLYETFAVPAPGKPVFQAAVANLNPRTEVRVDTGNTARGPLLIIEGEKDNTVPWAMANAAYNRQRRNSGVTEIRKIADRGHALVIDDGWKDVAGVALEFVKRFA